MSEINCYGDEVVYSNVVPGWCLVQLVNIPSGIEPFTVNGFVMGEGDFGLTNCNDPDFVFSMPPLPEPVEADTYPWSVEEKLFYERLDHYRDRLHGRVDSCYKLVKACIKAGYNEADGYLACWLMPKMYDSLQKGKLRTWTKWPQKNGLIIYQPNLPKEPYMPIVRLRDTKLPIEELKYATTPNWLKQAANNFTKEIVYVEYSHWDELADKHYHAIWSLDYVTWKYELREVGTYEHEYIFTEVTL